MTLVGKELAALTILSKISVSRSLSYRILPLLMAGYFLFILIRFFIFTKSLLDNGNTFS